MPEDDLNALYEQYRIEPSPDNLNRVVDRLSPTINYSLSAINAGNDNLIRSKARIFAAEAVQKFDPTQGASLPTWTSNQLMQLRRFKRETRQPVKVPERVQIDAWHLANSEQEFFEKHNREPDLEELADFAKMPIKRIEKVRNTFRKMPAQGAVEGAVTQYETDFTGEALEYVYRDEDAVGRKIIEMKTGFGGKYDPMEPKDIAIKLGLTPSQLSRRSASISLKIQEIERDLEDIQ